MTVEPEAGTTTEPELETIDVAEALRRAEIELAREQGRAEAATVAYQRLILTALSPGPDERMLDERIAAVQLELEDVPRRGHAEVATRSGANYSYDYILEADLMKAIRPLLAKHGVAVYYSDRILKEATTTTVEVTLTFRANGEEIACTAEGVGTDTGDKAANKAKTSAVRYLLWKMFLQPSDEDPEQENVERTEVEAAQATTRRAASSSARPATKARVLEALTKRSVELDEVQGNPPGRTLDRLPEIARSRFGIDDYPNGLSDAQLVEIGQALAQHLVLERAAAENETAYEPTMFSMEAEEPTG